MKLVYKELLLIMVCSGAITIAGDKSISTVPVYRGTSDASAAVSISEDLFVAADDENNILRFYKTTGQSPVHAYDVSEFLDIKASYPEADIEGATKIGKRIYWITSHGRNRDGKIRPNRHRLFATEVEIKEDKINIQPVGKPYKKLVPSLLKYDSKHNLGLDKATHLGINLSAKQRKKLAPKKEGLNIEALCASADGATIYIGFRNPQVVDKSTNRAQALVVPLKNAKNVTEKSDAPVFGEPLLWDLDGLGIRSMEYSSFHGKYFIIAGSSAETVTFALYQWMGNRNEQPIFVQQLSQSEFTPEAIVTFENSNRLLLLCDDGNRDITVMGKWECIKGKLNKDGTCPNKFLVDPNKKIFRAIWLEQ